MTKKNTKQPEMFEEAKEQISDVLEDMYDIMENVAIMSVDMIQASSETVHLSMNLFSNIAVGLNQSMEDLVAQNTKHAHNFLKCSNVNDLFSFNQNLFTNNFGVCSSFSNKCGDSMNIYTKGMSDILGYNFANNWYEKFRNKKRYR